MIALSADGLTVRYAGQPLSSAALRDVQLEVRTGERLLLVGPNGAGKTTFIRVFAGLMRPASGRALIGGQLARSARAEVGVVSHATYLYDELTAAENLWLYADLYGVPAPRARAAELLSTLGLAGESQTQVGRLSRGQQQRVAIARALVHDPPMLLLDEPDTGLDARAFEILEHLLVKSNRTVVLTTHNLALGLRMATRVAVLSHGLVVQDQPAASPQDAGRLLHLLADLARA